MATVICMFNHKGGVSKTTTSYGLGWMLAQKGKRVILVDADSQCNLTSIAMGEDVFEDFYVAEPTRNIKAALSPAFEAKPFPIEAVECVPVRGRDDLFLLPGSFELSEYEVSLGMSLTLTESMAALKNLPGSFAYLIAKTADHHQVDYVIIDMNPSLSAINEAMVVSSDFFIVPTAPDNFSTLALRSLARVLPRWEKWAVNARAAFADATYSLPSATPKFLGTVVQRFNIRNGKPTRASQEVIGRLSEVVRGTLVPALHEAGMTMDAQKYTQDDFCLAGIADFQTLNAVYHNTGIPVFALSDGQLGRGGTVLRRYQEMRDRFRKLFSDFADLVIAMTKSE